MADSAQHGMDGLSNISETHPQFTPAPLTKGDVHDHLEILKVPAHEAILNILRTEPEGTVPIVALGPREYFDPPSTSQRPCRLSRV